MRERFPTSSRSLRVAACVAGMLGVLLGVDRPARAEPVERGGKGSAEETWRPRRELSIGPADYVLAGSGAAITLGAALVEPRPSHVRGGVLFDDALRDALRITSESGRVAARTVSDVTVATSLALPVVATSLVGAWGIRKRGDIAWKWLVIDAEAFALTGALQGVTNVAVSRERPYGQGCLPDDETTMCTGPVRYRSFFSGHTAFAFTGAGLVCTGQLGLGIFGKPGDIAMCAGAMTLAASTGVLRIAGDMHYASDVLVGAVVGSAIGLGIPWLHMKAPLDLPSAMVHVRVVPMGQGLGLAGTF